MVSNYIANTVCRTNLAYLFKSSRLNIYCKQLINYLATELYFKIVISFSCFADY
jgi:hypothetical protein